MGFVWGGRGEGEVLKWVITMVITHEIESKWDITRFANYLLSTLFLQVGLRNKGAADSLPCQLIVLGFAA